MRPLLTPSLFGLMVAAGAEALLLLAAVWRPELSGLATMGMLGLIGYVGVMVLPTLLPEAPGSAATETDAAPHSTGEQDLAEGLQTRLEALLPGTRSFYQVRLRRRFWGWVCSVSSRVPALPWHYQVYTWGARPNLDKIARMLVGPLQWFTPQAKAHELAEDLLGRDGMQRVLAGTYFVPSQLSPSVEYRFTPYSLILYRGGRPLGSFCLQARGRYPLWDVVLSRIIMVQGSEVDFLRTAHFYGPVPPYFAVPMTRDQFLEIYGKEALERWDTYTSSTLGKATPQ